MADQEDRSFQPAPEHAGPGATANVDLTKLGQRDSPEEDWGEPLDADAQHGANHTVRPDRTEIDRSQGRKTRQAQKDIVSRRG